MPKFLYLSADTDNDRLEKGSDPAAPDECRQLSTLPNIARRYHLDDSALIDSQVKTRISYRRSAPSLISVNNKMCIKNSSGGG